MNRVKNKKIGLILFLAPALVLFCTFFVIPVIYVAFTSLCQWNGIEDMRFIGLENYKYIFSNPTFRLSIRNNVIWALVASFVQVPLALLMSLILARKPKGWRVFRTIYFFPQVISGIALAMLWQAAFNAEFGMVNGLLELVGLGKYTTNWLGNPNTALGSVIGYWVCYIGYYLIIIMSDITNVDQTYYEAAELDGASKIQQDIYITLPLIKNSIITCISLAAVMGIRTFEQVYAMTNGGPMNKTSVMGLFLYKEMQNGNYGRANASAMVLIAVGTFVVVTIRTLFNRKEKRGSKGV